MTNKANFKLALTISLSLMFAVATVAFLVGIGPLQAWQEQAWIPGFFSALFLLLSGYYFAEMDQRKNLLLMLAALILCITLPMGAALLMMV
ncbi:MAG: hypothetical protein AAF570_27435 [Bacteroidota bacterium]